MIYLDCLHILNNKQFNLVLWECRSIFVKPQTASAAAPPSAKTEFLWFITKNNVYIICRQLYL